MINKKPNSNFLNRKRQFIMKLSKAVANGEVDQDIIDVLELINSLPFAYTTSSCSGRIMLIDIPPSEKKFESIRIARWHQVINFETFWKTIVNYKPNGTLWLKVDSFIIAFAVSDIRWASFFLRLARLLGLKYSGIRSINLRGGYIIVDISSTEHVHLPLSDKKEGILIDEKYAQYIYNIAIKKLQKTKNRLNKFRKALRIVKEKVNEGKLDPLNVDFSIFEKLDDK